VLLLDWTVQIRQGAGRRRNTPATLFRSGVGRYSPECGVSRVPGLGLAWNLDQGHESDMRDSPEATKRWIGTWSEFATAGGGGELWGSSANERSRSTRFRLGPGSVCTSRWNEGGDLQGLKGDGAARPRRRSSSALRSEGRRRLGLRLGLWGGDCG